MGTGWMTKVGAAGMAFGAIGSALNDLSTGHLTFDKLSAYGTALGTALALFGIRRSVSQAADLAVGATVDAADRTVAAAQQK